MTRTRSRAAVPAILLGILLGMLAAAPTALADAPRSVLDAIRKRSVSDELNYRVYPDTDCFLDAATGGESDRGLSWPGA